MSINTNLRFNAQMTASKALNSRLDKQLDYQNSNLKKSTDDKQLMELSQNFEAIFVNQMLTSMRSENTGNDFIPESNGEKTFKSMLDEEYSKTISQQGALGLANAIYNQLKIQQK